MQQILCAIYTRLSKEDEDKQQSESESIQNQKSLLVHYAVEHGWDIYNIYCDEDWSGADSRRPDFNSMIEAAQQKKFQILLCKTQSRFTRDMELVEKYIHGLFPVWGIRFIAVADNADTEIKGNKKARQINGLVNEWYLEDLSENIRMVFDHKRKEGKYIGGCPVYGYRKDPADKNHIIVDPEAAEVVRQIFQWSLEGNGKQHIASMLNERGIMNPTKYKEQNGLVQNRPVTNEYGLWNRTTVYRILQNEMYTGVMVQGKTKKASYKSRTMIPMPESQWFRVEGTHEAIIDRETFDAVQAGMGLRSKMDGTGEAHILSGLVRCADCGSTMTKGTNRRNQDGSHRSYLRCKLFVTGGKRRLCTNHSIRLDQLIELVSQRIRFYVQSCFDLEKLDVQPRRNTRITALETEQKQLAAQLEKRNAALKSLYLDKVSGLLGEEQFLELNESFLKEKSHMEKRLIQIDSELAGTGKPEGKEGLMRRAEELLKLENIPRELVVLLIEKIEIGQRNRETGKQEVKILWKF